MHRGGAAARPAHRARVYHVPRHHPRAAAGRDPRAGPVRGRGARQAARARRNSPAGEVARSLLRASAGCTRARLRARIHDESAVN